MFGFDRITFDPNILGGKACIRGMRISGSLIVNLFAKRRSFAIIDVLGSREGPLPEWSQQADHICEIVRDAIQRIYLRNFSLIGKEADCEIDGLVPSYLDNLCRLGLAEIDADVALSQTGAYRALENARELVPIREEIEAVKGQRLAIKRKILTVTALGARFCFACVESKRSSESGKGQSEEQEK